MEKMKIPLLICLVGVGATTAQFCRAIPTKVPAAEISQLVITSYTGSDASNPKADYIYRIMLKRDGSAVYVGSNTYMKRTGRYQGVVDKRDFLRLANLFRQNGLLNGPNSYNKYTGPDYKGRQVAGVKYDITFGNRKKTISVYEDSGPKFIRRAGQIQYGLLWKIRWQKVSSSDSISG